jgi:hypothetical protein
MESMDPMQMLVDVLARKVTKAVDAQIRERVSQNLCVCCAAKTIYRDGQCRDCDSEVVDIISSMTYSKKVKYLRGLYESGLRLRPYEIRKYRKPMTELRRRAKEAS